MRDLLITCLVFGSLPIILMRPYIGILVWSWISYMNPHRLAWGFAYDMPFAKIIAITLLVAIIFNREKVFFPRDKLIVIWLAFIAVMIASSFLALLPEPAFVYLNRAIKIQLLTFICLLLMQDLQRIRYLIWVIVGSIGFYSVKGGLFTLLSGGSYRVWGPAESFIEENNSLALATLMVVPLMLYLWRMTNNKLLSWCLLGAIFLSLVSVLGSQSRGALVAIIAVSGFYWLKSHTKVISLVAILILAGFGWFFMPQSWHTRMATIQHYEQDASAMGRINAWHYSFNVANDRLLGAGFNSWSLETFKIYAPNPLDMHAAHSIYFGVLGDHGWPGLLLFVSILFFTWRNLVYVIHANADTPGVTEAYERRWLAKMIQVSLVAYMSGGAFLSLSYFDLPWQLMAIALLLKFQQQAPSDANVKLSRFRRPAIKDLKPAKYMDRAFNHD